MVGRSVDRSVGWLVVPRSVGSSVGLLVGFSVGRSIGRSMGRCFDQSVARSVGRSDDRSVSESSVRRSFYRSIGWYWSFNHSAGCSFGWVRFVYVSVGSVAASRPSIGLVVDLSAGLTSPSVDWTRRV